MQKDAVNNTKNLISVIVPVYNVENFLPYCINSILAQTYKNLEIILVDDGSTDSSPKICDDYQKKDSRIKVIHKKNGGLSSARNAGLDIATGDYIGFVDSDDTILPTMYEKLYNALIDNNAQVSICRFSYVDENFKNIENSVITPIKNEVLNGVEVIKKLCGTKFLGYYVIAWNKLYDKNIFKAIRFPNGRLHEDNFIAHKVFDLCDKVACIEDFLYLYTQRANSIMKSKFSIKRLDDLLAYLDRYEFCKEKYKDFAFNQLNMCKIIFSKGVKEIPYIKWPKEYKRATNKLIKYCVKEKEFKQAITVILFKIKYYFKPKKIKGGN